MRKQNEELPEKQINNQASLIFWTLYFAIGFAMWHGLKLALPHDALIVAYALVSTYSVAAVFALDSVEWRSEALLRHFWCMRHGGHQFDDMRVGSDLVGHKKVEGYEQCIRCDKVRKIDSSMR